jgi:hypothetical protein
VLGDPALAQEEKIMASSSRNVPSPRLSAPDEKTADSGKVRYGDGAITGGIPTLSIPDENTADSGKVRYGDGAITGGIPLMK